MKEGERGRCEGNKTDGREYDNKDKFGRVRQEERVERTKGK